MKIKIKMFLVFGLSVFLIMLLLSLGMFLFIQAKLTISLDNESRNIIGAVKESMTALENIAIENYLRATTEKTKDVIAHYYSQYEQGLITKEGFKEKTSEVVLTKKIGTTGYVAGVSSKGILSIHPKAEGVDISKTPFWPNVEALMASENRSGYLEYDWKNPNETAPRKKSGYITYFEPMDLIIWASSYKSEFAELVTPKDFHNAILALKVGKDGYPYILDFQGNMVIHPTLEGRNVYDVQAADGQKIFQTIVTRKEGKFEYDWKDPDGQVRRKIAIFDKIPGKDLVVAISSYKKDRYAMLYSIRNQLILAFCLSMAVIGLVVFFFSNIITKPIVKSVDFSRVMSKGDFTGKLEIRQKDEIGQLAAALNEMTGNIGGTFNLIQGRIEELAASSGELATISDMMSGSSEQMSENSTSLAQAAGEMNHNLESISHASDRVMENINSVASATKEMTCTISEIAKNSENAKMISGNAVAVAEQATGLVDKLGKAASEISKVTEAIDDISEQTNLLALNATIEAARAGEAGKGFAVVANEIKDLASETSNATREIENRITDIQGAITETVDKIKEISQTIMGVNEIVTSIAAAVEEQSVTTGEISRNMDQTSAEMQEVNENVTQSANFSNQITEQVGGVQDVSSKMAENSRTVERNSKSFSEMAQEIKTMLEKFKV